MENSRGVSKEGSARNPLTLRLEIEARRLGELVPGPLPKITRHLDGLDANAALEDLETTLKLPAHFIWIVLTELVPGQPEGGKSLLQNDFKDIDMGSTATNAHFLWHGDHVFLLCTIPTGKG